MPARLSAAPEFWIGGAGTTSGTFEYHLNGGTLIVPQIQKNAANGATGNFYLNGGTLRRPKIMQHGCKISRYAEVSSRFVIDTNGYNVTIGQSFDGPPVVLLNKVPAR